MPATLTPRTARRKVEETFRAVDTGETIRRPSLESAVQQWLIAKQVAAAAVKAEKDAANVLKAAFGDATYIETDSYTLSYKLQHRDEFVTPASSFRVLRVVEE